MKKILLLSYPRGGSNLVAYIIQASMGINVIGTNENIQVKCIPFNVFNHNEQCIVYKTHGHLNDINENNYDALIFCVRDFKKCVVNHCRSIDLLKLKEQCQCISATENGGNPDYLWLLKYYDEFKKDKIIIYYESLFKYPLQNIINLKSFLYQYIGNKGLDLHWQQKFSLFCRDFKEHFNTSLAMYQTKDHPDYAELHKSFNLDENAGEQLATYIKHTAGVLYNRYLTSYGN